MDNKIISDKLTQIADLLEIKSDKPFRIRAYRKAAAALASCETDIAQTYKKNKTIPKINGIGKSIGEKVTELLKTKKIKYLEKLKEDTANFAGISQNTLREQTQRSYDPTQHLATDDFNYTMSNLP